MPEPDPYDPDARLILLSAEQCALLLKALGHYNAEYALIVEEPIIDHLFDRLAPRADRG